MMIRDYWYIYGVSLLGWENGLHLNGWQERLESICFLMTMSRLYYKIFGSCKRLWLRVRKIVETGQPSTSENSYVPDPLVGGYDNWAFSTRMYGRESTMMDMDD